MRKAIVSIALLCAPFLPVLMLAFLEDRRALRAGMVRPRKGVVVRLRDNAIEVTTPPRPIDALLPGAARRRDRVERVPLAAVRRAVFVRDNLFATPPGLDMALNVDWGEGNTLRVQSMAVGFDELMAWARATVPFAVRVVDLGR